MINDSCIFCKIIAKEIPSSVVHETDDILVIKDIHPKAPVHYLILPKKHIRDIQALAHTDIALAGNMIGVAQELSKQLPENGDFKLVVNSGAQAGQEVFHMHFHFLSGKKLPEL